MIVLDTSVLVDAIIPKVKARHKLAMDTLSAIDARPSGKRIYVRDPPL
jgi:predicted nucleic acid-binding protein